MQVQKKLSPFTISVLKRSDVFEGTSESFWEFISDDVDSTFGDGDKTLVTNQRLRYMVEDAMDFLDTPKTTEDGKLVLSRLDEFPDSYIDIGA